jgi:CDP-diacylglycerol--serine O-phosphatidyltransferase
MRHLPNFLTSLNLASGFAAILFASAGNTIAASWIILAAMIFDFLDGFSARMLRAYSAIGKELDSLADVVSFGVAPGVIMYGLIRNSIMPEMPPGNSTVSLVTILIIAAAAIMPVCAALRLAIFNIDETQTKSFKGLPTPANALAVVSLVISSHYTDASSVINLVNSPALLITITFVLSLLMVSRIPLLSLKISDLKPKGNEGRYIMILLIIISFIIAGPSAALLVIPIYILSSLLSLLF